MVQLEHVDVADGGGLVETFASFAVIEVGATVFGKACFAHVTVNLLECGTVENRGLETFVEFFACPAQHSLVNLAKVHSRRNAEGVQDDVDRCAVGEERHVFGTYNLGHDTFVTVATGHFVADAQFALHGDVDFGHLDDSAREVVTDGESEFLTGEATVDFAVFDVVVVEEILDKVVGFRIRGPLIGADLIVVDSVECFRGEFDLFGDELFFVAGVDSVGGFAGQDDEKSVDEFFLEFSQFVVVFFLRFGKELFFLGALFAVADDAGKEFLVDDYAAYRRRDFEGGVFDVAGFVAEDCAEQFLFGRGVGFALGGDFTDKDVAFFDFGSDANDTVFVEVFGGVVADIGDVASEFLKAAFGFANFESVFFNVDRGEDVFAYNALGDNHSVLEVVSFPRHEGHFQVATQCQFTALGGIAFAKDLAFFDFVAFLDDGAQIDRGGVVGALIAGKFVFAYVFVEGDEAFFFRTVVADDDFGGVDIFDNTVAKCIEKDAAVFSHGFLNTGSHDRSFGSDKRHSLTHHVGAHQCAVSIVVFEEGNQGCGDGGNLVGTHVDEVDLFG